MKILVCGGRKEGCDPELIRSVLTEYLNQDPLIIHGDARGVDRTTGLIARQLGLDVLALPADWRRYGKAAGYRRNVRMADLEPDLVLAFPGGKGTQMMVDIALHRDIPVRRFGTKDAG